MSAPQQQPPGPPRPAGGAPTFIRRKPNTDPLRPRVKPRAKPIHALPPKNKDAKKLVDSSGELDKEIEREYAGKVEQLRQQRARNGGWSDQPAGSVQEFPLFTTKKSLREQHYHVMRLNNQMGGSEIDTDLLNQDQFPRPVTLHRRDPRLPPAHRMAMKQDDVPMDTDQQLELDRIQKMKADKEAQRALDQAQMAPVTKDSNPKPKANNKKEKASAFYGKHSDAHKKQSGLRYEETLPWHLEDAEGKAGVWVGSYVAGLSDSNVAFVIDGARFRMIPLERWYKFDEKPRFDTLSLDDAEKLMYEVKEVKRWVMKDKEREEKMKEKLETRMFLNGPTRVKTESATSRAARGSERQDDYELDISGDEFQDDDETPGFEADDEDTKESKERVRREQVAANLFGEGEEDKVEKEERERQLEKLKRKMIGKQTIKGLVKLEKAMDYDDGSESDSNNPFTDSSDSDDSDEEEKKEEEVKKPETSGANSKGNTTPSKSALAGKKGKLKRPGSPEMSESSDIENARKKMKTAKGSGVPSRMGTPIPGRPKVMAGATSDGEATAGEGSDGGAMLKKKLKLKAGGQRPGVTPSGSRAGSPAPPGQATTTSKTGTPSAAGSPPPPGVAKITTQEIHDALCRHPDGISLPAFMELWRSRLGKQGGTQRNEWISMVKSCSVFSQTDKLLKPKPGWRPT
ncbi:putative transcription initiation factor IIF subunit alpha [Triangularia verruculosa]|uniref:Transcription initiation factor IIF subunit alpha n=1 Tax=Triangularia verruculosa TaxID=2587418 RepID=A0AAN6XPE4_9PEZI|nr:putative transcription initiation factor IIF subunit alpha [Triangularia verruculosa]